MQYASAYAEDLHNYFHEFVDSALDCAKYAKTINGSLFWSWNHQNKACYPKTSNSDKKPAPPSGATSGTVECWEGPSKDCQTFEVAICMQCILCTGNPCSLGTFFYISYYRVTNFWYFQTLLIAFGKMKPATVGMT